MIGCVFRRLHGYPAMHNFCGFVYAVMFQITNSPGSFTVTETASTLAESIVVSLLVGTLPFPVEIVLNDIGTAKRSGKRFLRIIYM